MDVGTHCENVPINKTRDMDVGTQVGWCFVHGKQATLQHHQFLSCNRTILDLPVLGGGQPSLPSNGATARPLIRMLLRLSFWRVSLSQCFSRQSRKRGTSHVFVCDSDDVAAVILACFVVAMLLSEIFVQL